MKDVIKVEIDNGYYLFKLGKLLKDKWLVNLLGLILLCLQDCAYILSVR